MFNKKIMKTFKAFLPRGSKSRFCSDKLFLYLDIFYNKQHIAYLFENGGIINIACIQEKRFKRTHTEYSNVYHTININDPNMYKTFMKILRKHIKYVKSR